MNKVKNFLAVEIAAAIEEACPYADKQNVAVSVFNEAGANGVLKLYSEISKRIVIPLDLRSHLIANKILMQHGINPIDFMAFVYLGGVENQVTFDLFSHDLYYEPTESVARFTDSFKETINNAESMFSIFKSIHEYQIKKLSDLVMYLGLMVGQYSPIVWSILGQPDLKEFARNSRGEYDDIFLTSLIQACPHIKADNSSASGLEQKELAQINRLFVKEVIEASHALDETYGFFSKNLRLNKGQTLASIFIKHADPELVKRIALVRIKLDEPDECAFTALLCGFSMWADPTFVVKLARTLEHDVYQRLLFVAFSFLEKCKPEVKVLKLLKSLDQALQANGLPKIANSDAVHGFLVNGITADKLIQVGVVSPGLEDQENFCAEHGFRECVKVVDMAIQLGKKRHLANYLNQLLESVKFAPQWREDKKESARMMIRSSLIDIYDASQFDQASVVDLMHGLGIGADEIAVEKLGAQARKRLLNNDLEL